MFEIDALTGELGGLLAAAFASGAVAGWGFAQKTAVKLANERIGELREEVDELRTEQRRLHDQMIELAQGKKV